jgi:hypothetical protein
MQREKADIKIYSDEEIRERGFVLDVEDFQYPDEEYGLNAKDCLIDITVDSSEIIE